MNIAISCQNIEVCPEQKITHKFTKYDTFLTSMKQEKEQLEFESTFEQKLTTHKETVAHHKTLKRN